MTPRGKEFKEAQPLPLLSGEMITYILGFAEQEAKAFSHDQITQEHLLLALLRSEQFTCLAEIFSDFNLWYDLTRNYIEATKIAPAKRVSTDKKLELTPDAREVVEQAAVFAIKRGAEGIFGVDLLFALVNDDTAGAELMESMGVRPYDLVQAVARRMNEESEHARNNLNELFRDMLANPEIPDSVKTILKERFGDKT